MSEAKASALTVRAEWDPTAGVGVAESDDVPGLVTEADTLERLVERLRVLVPELLVLNCAAQRSASIELVTRLPENSCNPTRSQNTGPVILTRGAAVAVRSRVEGSC